MAKSILGVDIGHDSLKLVLIEKGVVEKVVIGQMPENMISEGSIVSPEAMGETIKALMKANKIRCKNAAIVLNDQISIIRTIQMPKMTESQLLYNIPYEFKDYITEETSKYLFDYAMLSDELEQEEEVVESEDESIYGYSYQENSDGESSRNYMEVLGVAVLKSELENIRFTLKKAGLKMLCAAPAISGYASIIRKLQQKESKKEYCFLDIGFNAIRMHIFEGDAFKVTRELESGLSLLMDVIADEYNVDRHLAHTYMITNYDSCLENRICEQVYYNINTEIMRVIHFYQFSNPDSNLREIYLCGGGSSVNSLYQIISDTDEIIVRRAEELMQDVTGNHSKCSMAMAAMGLALQ